MSAWVVCPGLLCAWLVVPALLLYGHVIALTVRYGSVGIDALDPEVRVDLANHISKLPHELELRDPSLPILRYRLQQPLQRQRPVGPRSLSGPASHM